VLPGLLPALPDLSPAFPDVFSELSSLSSVLQHVSKLITITHTVLLYQSSEIPVSLNASRHAPLGSDTLLTLTFLSLHHTSSQWLLEASGDKNPFCWCNHMNLTQRQPDSTTGAAVRPMRRHISQFEPLWWLLGRNAEYINRLALETQCRNELYIWSPPSSEWSC